MAQQNKELISVLVPVFGVEKYLIRCVSSILAQTYTNLEIILVDDGSTDNSGEMCDDFAVKDSRVRVIHQANGGLACARNTAMNAADGEFILFVDSDDWIAPDMIEMLHNILKKHNADIAECGYIHLFANAALHETQCTGLAEVMDGNGAVEDMLENRIFRSIVCNKLYRRSAVGEIRFPLGKLHEDEFTVHHLYFAAKKVVFVDLARYYYDRTREDAITSHKFTSKRLDGCEALHERMHLVWKNELTSMEEKMNNRYSFVLFYRLYECYSNGMNDEKVRETVSIALKNIGQIQEEGRPLNPRYIPLYKALEDGLQSFCHAWENRGWQE